MKHIVLLLVLVLAISACGGDATSETTTPDDATATQETAESEESSDPDALDFELLLADGSTFTLSDEEKPVYVVFWAEW